MIGCIPALLHLARVVGSNARIYNGRYGCRRYILSHKIFYQLGEKLITSSLLELPKGKIVKSYEQNKISYFHWFN